MRCKAANFGKGMLVLFFLMVISCGVFSHSARAQQMVVDDATVLIDKQAQLEAWYGTEESWIQPSLSLSHLWDFTPGIIFDTANEGGLSNIFGELKYVPTDLDFDGYSYGWTGAVVFDTDGRVDRVYSYIPFTKFILDRTSKVHLNVGFDGRDNVAGDWEYGFTTGIRADLGLTDRFTILTELFTTDFETPSFQAGVRFIVVPGLFDVDVTYGESFRSEVSYPGFNVGISLRPNRIW